jgi:hypothetical protein
MQQPSSVQGKNLDSPDETRRFENGKTDVVSLGEITVGRAVFEPGWRRSETVRSQEADGAGRAAALAPARGLRLLRLRRSSPGTVPRGRLTEKAHR